jgi:ubiquitin
VSVTWLQQLSYSLSQLASLTVSGDACFVSGLHSISSRLQVLSLSSRVLLKPEISFAEPDGDSNSDDSADSDGEETARTLNVDFSCPSLASQLVNAKRIRWLATEPFEPKHDATAAKLSKPPADAAEHVESTSPLQAAPAAAKDTAATASCRCAAPCLLPALQDLAAVALPAPGVLCPAAFTSFSQLRANTATTAEAAPNAEAAAAVAALSGGELTHTLQRACVLTQFRQLSCSVPLPVLQLLLPYWQQLTCLKVELEVEQGSSQQQCMGKGQLQQATEQRQQQ